MTKGDACETEEDRSQTSLSAKIFSEHKCFKFSGEIIMWLLLN